MSGRFLFAILLTLFSALTSYAQSVETLVSAGSEWRWRKGTNEVSNPSTLWRNAGFGDAGWLVSTAPFWYGDDPGGGTLLSDMQGSYSCIFLRSTFVVTNIVEVQSLRLWADYDDGFVAWVNGTEIARANVDGQPSYSSVASANHESGSLEIFNPGLAPDTYLAEGSNVLAVQAFNRNISTSSDFFFDGELQITRNLPPDGMAPSIQNAVPTQNSSVSALNQITIVFSESVAGVDPSDLLINDLPATGLVGAAGTNQYTFTFTQPMPGAVLIDWEIAHGITDLEGNPFDSAGLGATWNYILADTVAPQISRQKPAPGTTVSQLTQFEVYFDEPVFGVDASDLLVNGQPATNITGAEIGPYVFTFPPPAPGTVSLSWATGSDIADVASNEFVGAGKFVVLNPNLAPGDIVINEFIAGNLSGLADEDSERQDWIELYNRGTNAVNLSGWSLTDNPDLPGQWTFPFHILNPGEYLVVFASAKDRRAPSGSERYHTNFKLDRFGDYLGLFNAEYPAVAVSEFAPGFPEQRNNYSYGLDNAGQHRYFSSPTPGSANGSSSIVGVAPEPHFSVGRGFFDQPFNLPLTTTLAGATIRYTTDGSEPTASNGSIYSQPLTITNTACIRAAVFAANYLPSRTKTHSYIYLDSVPTQPNTPSGFPTTWGTYTTFPGNIVPADYEMDTDPLRTDPNNPASSIDPMKLQRLKDGLRELPSVSIVMNVDDIFTSSGMYHSANVRNKSFPDQPCSVEMILPDGSTAFAVDAGLRMHGNASREPSKNPKHGFKISFKGEFGESSLEYRLFPDSPAREFDDLILRADFGTSWRHWSDTAGEGLGAFQRSRGTRTRDAWFKDTFRDMGRVASHNRFCHLFINGLYWGTYDFTEQANASFAPNSFGGEKEDFDVYEQGQLKNGTSTAYNIMTGISSLTENSNYELMKQYLDVEQHIDSLVMHLFIGHQDWGGTKNWYAIRKRTSGPLGRFKYLPWDGENLLLNENIDRDRSPGGYGWPSGLHDELVNNAQYRLDFADRVHRHMIALDGALTPDANIARWAKWMKVMDKPIVAESARWGDYRRDVHQWQNGTYDLYTREDQWLAESNRIVNTYLPNRNATVLSQFRRDGLYPDVDAPEFRENNTAGPILASDVVAAGFVLAMRNPGSGTVYYTTNGVDPRVYYSGLVANDALPYSAPITLNTTITLKARVLSGGVWSALNEATFTVGEFGLPLRITEIMYAPVGGGAFEFIELMNVGALPLNLSGFSLQGIDFIFADGTVLHPGSILVLASNDDPSGWASRYPGVTPVGHFGGSLNNGGERIAILDGNGRTVVAVHYHYEDGWPLGAEGAGRSLEIIDPRGDPNAPANWRASSNASGSPGLPHIQPSLADVIINEVMAENLSAVTNGGLFPDWVELHNRTAGAIDISNWSITDNSDPRRFIFPANTVIPANGYLVVWCDGATNAPGLHTGFALGRNGETVSLFNEATNRVDALTFGLQLADYSVGRVAEEWRLTLPTPGADNSAAPLASSSNLAINEWLTDPPPGEEDWIELFNRSADAPAALSGLGFDANGTQYRYQALSFIAPQGHVRLYADELPGADHMEFKLSATAGEIALYDEAAIELERVNYGLQTEAVSEGRLPDGTATITAFPGSASPGASNYLLDWSGPVLNEVLARNGRAVVSPWGNYADFVEVFNPGASTFDLSGMALGRSDNTSERWIIPGGVSLGAGEYLVIWCDGSRPASTVVGAGLNSGFNLPGESGSAMLFNAMGQPVDRVDYGFQIGDLPIGRDGNEWQLLATATPGAANSSAATLGPVSALRINEWMAAPLAGDDWFELYNTNALPVNLGGLFITDDPSIAGIVRSPVAPLSFVAGRNWVLLVADGNRSAGRDHANFSLDQLGETLRLYDANTNLIDVVDFGVQSVATSQGRLPDGAGGITSFPTTPSPGAANFLPITSIVINEVLTHTDDPLEDAIELHNPTGSPVNIGGWYLSDSQTDLKRYRIPDGTSIPAGGFKVFYQYQFGPADGEADVPPLFSFNSARGDSAYLSEADGAGNLTGMRVGMSFDAAANGVSFGRYETSMGVDFVALAQRSFGEDNPSTLAEFRAGTGGTNAYPLVGPVVISEIMYRPPGWGTNASDVEEFIELHNLSSSPVELFDPAHPGNRWRVANAVGFEFPADTTIPAGGHLLVVSFDPVTDAAALTAFQSRYGSSVALVGPFSGRLDNAGEAIELWRPDNPQMPPHPDAGFVPQILVERVVYDDIAPWPVIGGFDGLSLQRIATQQYGNDPVNWRAAVPTAGRTNIPQPSGSVIVVGNGDVQLTFNVQPGLTYQWEYKDDLADSEWLPLGAPILADGETLVLDDELAGQSQRFYRLTVLP